MKIGYISALLVCITGNIHTMEIHKALLERIQQAQKNKDTDAFATTLLLRYQNGNHTFKGDISEFDAEDEKDILAGNYVYEKTFGFMPTRLSPKEPVRVAALILGTNDPSVAKKYPYSLIRLINNNHVPKL